MPRSDRDTADFRDGGLSLAPAPLRPAHAEGPCPVDRLPSRRRNELCIAIIALGLLNLVLYTVTYAVLGGDAHNGQLDTIVRPDGAAEDVYIVRGHFLHSLTGRERTVNRTAWMYSYVHSISVPLTSGAMIISMLVLARPHIVATMRGGRLSGRTFTWVFGAAVVLLTGGATVLLTVHFINELTGAT